MSETYEFLMAKGWPGVRFDQIRGAWTESQWYMMLDRLEERLDREAEEYGEWQADRGGSGNGGGISFGVDDLAKGRVSAPAGSDLLAGVHSSEPYPFLASERLKKEQAAGQAR